MSNTFRALRHPYVARFAGGRFFSAMAAASTATALGFQLYEETGSALSLGLVGLVEVVPVLTLALPAGVVADRFPRRSVAIVAHVLLAFSALSFLVLTRLHAPPVAFYLLLVLNAVGMTLRAPAVGAMLPQLVPAADFMNANALFSSTFELAAVVGPAVAGGLIAVWGDSTLAFGLSTVAHLVFIGVLVSMPHRPAAHSGKTQGFNDLLVGLRFVRRTRVFLAAITLDMFAVLLGGAVALLPIFAKDVLDIGPKGLGWLRAAPALGALSMALVHTRLPSWRRPGLTLLVTVVGFGVATIGFGLSTAPWLSFVCLFFSGVFDNVSVVIRSTLEQALTPDSMRGRVSAIHHVFLGISNELGSFESGMTAELFGPIASVVGGGVGTVLVVALVAWRFPRLRELPPLHELRPSEPSSP